jgi:hypothetical protein
MTARTGSTAKSWRSGIIVNRRSVVASPLRGPGGVCIPAGPLGRHRMGYTQRFPGMFGLEIFSPAIARPDGVGVSNPSQLLGRGPRGAFLRRAAKLRMKDH